MVGDVERLFGVQGSVRQKVRKMKSYVNNKTNTERDGLDLLYKMEI